MITSPRHIFKCYWRESRVSLPYVQVSPDMSYFWVYVRASAHFFQILAVRPGFFARGHWTAFAKYVYTLSVDKIS